MLADSAMSQVYHTIHSWVHKVFGCVQNARTIKAEMKQNPSHPKTPTPKYGTVLPQPRLAPGPFQDANQRHHDHAINSPSHLSRHPAPLSFRSSCMCVLRGHLRSLEPCQHRRVFFPRTVSQPFIRGNPHLHKRSTYPNARLLRRYTVTMESDRTTLEFTQAGVHVHVCRRVLLRSCESTQKNLSCTIPWSADLIGPCRSLRMPPTRILHCA